MALTQIDDRGLKTPIDLLDNEKIRFGTGNDLEIYHDGSNSIIDNNTGQLRIQGDLVRLMNSAGSKVALEANVDGNVELYYDNSKKFETYASGTKNTGNLWLVTDSDKALFGDGTDLQISHDGTDNIINNHSADLHIKHGADVQAKFIQDGAVELYHDNSKKLETRSDGIGITGILNMSSHIYLGDSDYLIVGAGNDYQLYHDGTNTQIRNSTGSLLSMSDTYDFRSYSSNETMIKGVLNGAVELYYDGTKKFETTSYGVLVSSRLNASTISIHDYDSSDSSGAIKLGTGNDLQIYHNGTNSYITNSTGWLQIQADNAEFVNAANSEYKARLVNNAEVSLYYDGSKKAYTYSEGFKVNGYMKALADVSDAHAGDNTADYHTIQSSSETSSTLLLEHSGNSTPRGVYAYFSDAAPDNATQYFLYCEDNSAVRAKINSNGSFESADNSYGSISDVKLKENIVDAKSQWDDVKALKIRNFNFKRKPDTKLLGVVAQEVETISPGIVYESEDLELGGASKGTTTKGVKYSILYMKAIKALQEAMARIETLETEVAALKAK